jgi:hypothetical protein
MNVGVSNNAADMRAGRLLRRFLGFTPNLTHLRLNMPKYQMDENAEFLQWLALSHTPTGSLVTNDFFEPPAVSLAHLTALDLGQFQARPHVLLNLIAKFAPTLQKLELWKMALSLDPAVRASNPKTNVWSIFFAKLAKVPQLQLMHLKVGMLSQENTFVQFKASDKDDAPMLKVKIYTGKKMDGFLKELKEEVTVVWRPEDLAQNNDDTENDEDEDEEMADDDDDDESDDEDYDE